MAKILPHRKRSKSKKTAAKTPAVVSMPSGSSQTTGNHRPPTSLRRRLVAKVRRPAGTAPKLILPPAWEIAGKAVITLRQNWQLFSGITLIYALLTLLLVGGYGLATDPSVKTVLNSDSDKLSSALAALLQLFGTSSGSTDAGAGIYQFLLTLIGGLAIVWALRQVWAGTARVRIRDAYYQGMYPLVPVILVLLVITLQLVPLLLGAALYTAVLAKAIAASPIEHMIIAVVCLLLALLSVYMLISSTFALYIAALPDMTPLRALRSARELVRYRRLPVLRKLLFLPLVLLLGTLVIMLPIVLLLTPVAAVVFIVLTMAGLPIIHAYLYALYRELLNE